jgi:hypothetical protein
LQGSPNEQRIQKLELSNRKDILNTKEIELLELKHQDDIKEIGP